MYMHFFIVGNKVHAVSNFISQTNYSLIPTVHILHTRLHTEWLIFIDRQIIHVHLVNGISISNKASALLSVYLSFSSDSREYSRGVRRPRDVTNNTVQIIGKHWLPRD